MPNSLYYPTSIYLKLLSIKHNYVSKLGCTYIYIYIYIYKHIKSTPTLSLLEDEREIERGGSTQVIKYEFMLLKTKRSEDDPCFQFPCLIMEKGKRHTLQHIINDYKWEKIKLMLIDSNSTRTIPFP